jgi:hypothetical protein
MYLDSTAQKTNFYYSLKKYVIDNIYIVQGIPVIFDNYLPPDAVVNRWISVIQRPLSRDVVSEYEFDIYCVTRNDYEGDKLIELLDLIAGYFAGDTTQTDGLRRIPFFDAATQTQNGSMVVTDCSEGEQMEAPDQSKFIILTIIAKMASKI